jgi:predicted ATPase
MNQTTFLKVSRSSYVQNNVRDVIVLKENNWDDFGFKTMFYASYIDASGEEHDLGDVKIGYMSQQPGWTGERLPLTFSELSDEFFSIGQSTDYYSSILRSVPKARAILIALRDLALLDEARDAAYQTRVFSDSLSRNVSTSTIEGQYRRIIEGGVILTPFDFRYYREQNDQYSEVALDFKVEPESKPPSNIHVLIGRNGVGKTTLLNGMTTAIAESTPPPSFGGKFFSRHLFGYQPITDNYFSSVSSVSFSAFDPFDPPRERHDKDKGPCHFYIGLKKSRGSVDSKADSTPQLRNFDELAEQFSTSLRLCLSQESKREKWLKCISILESDPNFEEMQLRERALSHKQPTDEGPIHFFRNRMSSGHAVVLLTLTKLVETVEEKTLVIIDEPESHLHPPLLAAFTRSLSYLLSSTNAVAIIATHSPVVLQEVPMQCAWKLRRSKLSTVAERPERETFGENVGILTREIFGLEVSKSGFHALLAESVSRGMTFEEILSEYGGQIGFEGQTIVRSLIAARSNKLAAQ